MLISFYASAELYVQSFHIVGRRNYLTVTRKALAFPASSAHQPCSVVTLQPVRHLHNLPAAVWGLKEKPRHCGEMVLLTMIARLADGLPLAASMQEDEQVKKQNIAVFSMESLAVSLLWLQAYGYSFKRNRLSGVTFNKYWNLTPLPTNQNERKERLGPLLST